MTDHCRDCAKTPRIPPRTVDVIATRRRSVFSIARVQWKHRHSGYLLPDGPRARVEQIGHSYGVMESLGIAGLSRGHSYAVAAPTFETVVSLFVGSV
jgi:hypothetical protein